MAPVRLWSITVFAMFLATTAATDTSLSTLISLISAMRDPSNFNVQITSLSPPPPALDNTIVGSDRPTVGP